MNKPELPESQRDLDIYDKTVESKEAYIYPVDDYYSSPTLESADMALMINGFFPLKRIFFKKESGTQGCYIKARSPDGFIVYIHIDTGNLTTFGDEDLFAVETREAHDVPIPSSYTRGAFQMAQGNVMTECNEGVCHITSNPRSIDPVITKYKFMTMDGNPNIKLEGTVRYYPSVKLSEIKSNIRRVLARIENENTAAKNRAEKITSQQLKKFMNELKQLVDISNTYVQEHAKIHRELEEELVKSQGMYNKLSLDIKSTDRPADMKRLLSAVKEKRDTLNDLSDDFQDLTINISEAMVSVTMIRTDMEYRLMKLDEVKGKLK
jgi:hypothetical protein